MKISSNQLEIIHGHKQREKILRIIATLDQHDEFLERLRNEMISKENILLLTNILLKFHINIYIGLFFYFLQIMSVLVPSLANHHHTTYFSSTNNRRIHGNPSQTKTNRLSLNPTIDHDPNKDHVPYGVVNSMKQRLLNKVNESFLFNPHSTLNRHSLSKPSSRLSSNENLLQTKPIISPLKRTTRLSRSQDNLTNNQIHTTEEFTSYIQPKQDVIIVDVTSDDNDGGDDDAADGKLHPGQKTSAHRQSYTELHMDEAPKPGRSSIRIDAKIRRNIV